MKKINQSVLDKAVEAHIKKQQTASIITITMGAVGLLFFFISSLMAEPGDSVQQAYGVGVVFSLLVAAFGIINLKQTK